MALDHKTYSLDTRARHLLDTWRQWAEHQHLSKEKFDELVDDTDIVIDELVDRELATKRPAEQHKPEQTNETR